MKHQNMETSLLTTKAFIGYPLDLAQRVGQVGIASACRRQAFIRSASAQARVIWQGTGGADFRSRSCAVDEKLVALHANVRGLGFVLWTAALPLLQILSPRMNPKVKGSASIQDF